jgi:hypothetical protein
LSAEGNHTAIPGIGGAAQVAPATFDQPGVLFTLPPSKPAATVVENCDSAEDLSVALLPALPTDVGQVEDDLTAVSEAVPVEASLLIEGESTVVTHLRVRLLIHL